MSRAPAIACFQFVTSGLSPDDSFLLEVGVSAIDRETLESRARFHSLVAVNLDELAKQCPPELFVKYDANGLFEKLLAPDLPASPDVDVALAHFLDEHGAAGTPKSPIVAFGADWTAQWLRAKLPASFARLGSGRIDVGELCRAASKVPHRDNANARLGASCAASELVGVIRGVRSIPGVLVGQLK